MSKDEEESSNSVPQSAVSQGQLILGTWALENNTLKFVSLAANLRIRNTCYNSVEPYDIVSSDKMTLYGRDNRNQ